ncbi:hypothetical protein P8452_35359 [Trifolium repens]|nr:hypothetical protein P8452_35359 [Trifolium repens]
MGMFKWRSFILVSFYFLYLITCYNVSATSTQIMSNTKQDDIVDDLINICSIVYCGKGTCHQQPGLFNFSCDCDSGWKKLKVGSFEFPTCVLPNCTLNLECGNGILPTLPTQPPNQPDPCLFNLCGDGTCVKNGIDFKCQCNEGAANVGNDPKMFCLKKCGIGGDCNGLDFGFTPEAAASPPPPATPNSGNGSGEMLNCTKKLYMLTMMILAITFQNWI